jgi:tetratricopeptide (TPR) repeat protein
MRNVALILATAVLAVLGTSCTQLKARNQINQGVAAFKSAQYPEAVEHFKTAVELDPSFITARLYLATAYMQQYVPGSEVPENLKMAQEAHNQFQKVLDTKPTDKTALASVASLYLNEKKWDDAEAAYKKYIAAYPDESTGYYSIGFITWSKWYVPYEKARSEAGMKPEDPGPIKDKKIKAELKEKYSAMLDDGLKNLDLALQKDPDYDDAMAYENLLVRERADLADNKADYEAQVKVADGWVDKAMATKKKKVEQKEKQAQGGGITLDTSTGK